MPWASSIMLSLKEHLGPIRSCCHWNITLGRFSHVVGLGSVGWFSMIVPLETSFVVNRVRPHGKWVGISAYTCELSSSPWLPVGVQFSDCIGSSWIWFLAFRNDGLTSSILGILRSSMWSSIKSSWFERFIIMALDHSCLIRCCHLNCPSIPWGKQIVDGNPRVI